jgi:hypothetical protein
MFPRWAALVAALTLVFSWIVFRPADLFFYGDTWDIFRDFTQQGLATLRILHNEHFVPLPHLLLYLQFRLFGMEAFGFHAVSIVLHAINGILLYRLTCWLTPSNTARVIGALVFSMSGVYWEAIQHEVVQQFVLALTFTLAAAVLTLEFLDRKRIRWIAGAGACLLAASLCTSLGLLASPLVLMLALTGHPRRSFVSVAAAVLCATGVYALSRSLISVQPGIGSALEPAGIGARLPWLAPFLWAAISEGALRASWPGPLALGLLCVPAARRPFARIVFPVALFVMPLLFVALGRASEGNLDAGAFSRYQYFPMAGLGLFTAWALGPAIASRRWLAGAAIAALIVQLWSAYAWTRQHSPRAEWGLRARDFFKNAVLAPSYPPKGMFEARPDYLLPQSCYPNWSPLWSLYPVLSAGGWRVDSNQPLLLDYITTRELRAMDQLAARHPKLGLDQWDRVQGANVLSFDRENQIVRIELSKRESKYRFTLGRIPQPRVPYSFSAMVQRRGGESPGMIEVCFLDGAGGEIECSKSTLIDQPVSQVLLTAGFPPREAKIVTMGLGMHEYRGSPAVIDLRYPLAVEHPVYLPEAMRKR